MTPSVVAVTRTAPEFLPRAAAVCAVASAAIGAVGVAFLLGMFTAFALGARTEAVALGGINDVLILVSYPLSVPAIVALRNHIRPGAPIATDSATVVAVAAIAAIAVLQGLLVRDVLTFEEQVGPVSVAILALGASLVALGWLGNRSGVLPGGTRMGLVGATYFGYPAWALWTARRLWRGIIRLNHSSAG